MGGEIAMVALSAIVTGVVTGAISSIVSIIRIGVRLDNLEKHLTSVSGKADRAHDRIDDVLMKGGK